MSESRPHPKPRTWSRGQSERRKASKGPSANLFPGEEVKQGLRSLRDGV